MKKTEAEWKRSLTDQEYRILREKEQSELLLVNTMATLKKVFMSVLDVEVGFLNLKQNIDLDVVGLHFMKLSQEQLKSTKIIHLG